MAKLITITDCGAIVEYRLDGSCLTMTRTGGCQDVLHGLRVAEGVSNRVIQLVVYTRWAGPGYDGDPEENGLSVEVEEE